MNSSDVAGLVSNADDLLALEREEQGRLILKLLTSGQPNQVTGLTMRGTVNRDTFFNRANDYARPPKFGQDKQKEVDDALQAAWIWLVNEGLLVQAQGEGPGWFKITPTGCQLGAEVDASAYAKKSLLPKKQIHPLIADKVYPAFMRGEYDTAIFQVFREIEIAVRQAAGKLSQDLVGEKLMRAAFAPSSSKGATSGPLTDAGLPAGEQAAMSHMFAGAFGLYRNSTAHRYVPTNPNEAVEVIMFASQLMRIVDRRKP